MPTKKKMPVAAAKPAKKAAKPEAKKPAPKKTIVTKPAPKAAKPAPKPMKKAVPSKPVAKAPAKPVAKTPAKPVAKAPAKPVAKTPAKPVAKAPAKPVAKAPAKPVAKVPAKPVAKAPVKPVEKVPAKPVAKAPVKPVPAPVKKEAEVVKPTAPKKIETPQSEVVKTAAKLAEIRKAARAQEAKKVQKPVVMPKINATTSRPYQPEFTKSVLDQPSQEYTGPTMRYSDAELVEFKELISRKLEAAKKELSYLHGLITRKDEMSGDETDNRYMTMEDGSLSMEREQLSQMASRQIDFIDKLEKALIRIENKTYGICRVTGKLIDKARLRAVPHATLSMEAKVGMARNPNVQ
jgi:RNA polymerase-binding transcription factor DksA